MTYFKSDSILLIFKSLPFYSLTQRYTISVDLILNNTVPHTESLSTKVTFPIKIYACQYFQIKVVAVNANNAHFQREQGLLIFFARENRIKSTFLSISYKLSITSKINYSYTGRLILLTYGKNTFSYVY